MSWASPPLKSVEILCIYRPCKLCKWKDQKCPWKTALYVDFAHLQPFQSVKPEAKLIELFLHDWVSQAQLVEQKGSIGWIYILHPLLWFNWLGKIHQPIGLCFWHYCIGRTLFPTGLIPSIGWPGVDASSCCSQLQMIPSSIQLPLLTSFVFQ